MKVELKKVHLSEAKENLLCVFLMQDEEPPYDIRRFMHDVKKQRYEGKLLQTLSADTRGEAKFRHLLVVGLGKKEEFRADNLRRAAGLAARYAASRKEAGFAMHLPSNFIARHDLMAMVQAMTEGALLASYRFYEYKTKREDLFEVEEARVISEEDVAEGVRLGTIYMASSFFDTDWSRRRRDTRMQAIGTVSVPVFWTACGAAVRGSSPSAAMLVSRCPPAP